MIEFGSLAKGRAFARSVLVEIELLDHFVKQGVSTFTRKTPVALGALVDVRTGDDEGAASSSCRSAPEPRLTGPGGDGFVSVITPQSPVGKQLLGRRVGESVDVTIKGDTYEWTVVDVG